MEQTIIKIGQSPLSMQAVPLASSIYKPSKILPARGKKPNKNK